MTYKVNLSPDVSKGIDTIYQYMSTILSAPKEASRVLPNLLSGLKELEQYAELGFNFDQKIGAEVNSQYITRGKVIDGYVFLYFIDYVEDMVYVSHLFHTKSDYVTLLK